MNTTPTLGTSTLLTLSHIYHMGFLVFIFLTLTFRFKIFLNKVNYWIAVNYCRVLSKTNTYDKPLNHIN